MVSDKGDRYMKRVAFTMKLLPGCKEEYRKRHDQVWPEITRLLRDSGVSEYSIFLDETTNTLFAYQKVVGDLGSQDLGQTEVVQKWWAYMADIMETNEDNSPVTVPIEELFFMA
jgi:L-rhamnose mutarotase